MFNSFVWITSQQRKPATLVYCSSRLCSSTRLRLWNYRVLTSPVCSISLLVLEKPHPMRVTLLTTLCPCGLYGNLTLLLIFMILLCLLMIYPFLPETRTLKLPCNLAPSIIKRNLLDLFPQLASSTLLRNSLTLWPAKCTLNRLLDNTQKKEELLQQLYQLKQQEVVLQQQLKQQKLCDQLSSRPLPRRFPHRQTTTVILAPYTSPQIDCSRRKYERQQQPNFSTFSFPLLEKY